MECGAEHNLPPLFWASVERRTIALWQPCLCLREADTHGKPRAIYRHGDEKAWEQLLEEAEVGLGNCKATELVNANVRACLEHTTEELW